jgi:hypothetical protein
VRWPAGNSGRTDTRISQHSMGQGVSIKLTIINEPLLGT